VYRGAPARFGSDWPVTALLPLDRQMSLPISKPPIHNKGVSSGWAPGLLLIDKDYRQ
jgi:hypothetical protein